MVPKQRILFLDAYDSFSNNIISLLETTLGVEVRSVPIDHPAIDSPEKLISIVKKFDAVVCGPGPGHPQNDKDVGAMKNIWKLKDEDLVPVLGICLGFQSLCLEFGADIKRLKGPQHGIVRRINHIGEFSLGLEEDEEGQQEEEEQEGENEEEDESIFRGISELNATLYQSLCADIGQDEIPESVWKSAKWKPTTKCPDLLPLAWVESELTGTDTSDLGIADRRVFVGVRHRVTPFWALQYHPESICSNRESREVIRNWFQDALQWSSLHMRKTDPHISPSDPTKMSLNGRYMLVLEHETKTAKGFSQPTDNDTIVSHYHSVRIPREMEVPDIVQRLQSTWQDCIVLESSNASSAEKVHTSVRGRYSIIGLDASRCKRYEYTVDDKMAAIIEPAKAPATKPTVTRIRVGSAAGFWMLISSYLEEYPGMEGHPRSPFLGGLIGYTTYEFGLERLKVHQPPSRANVPQQSTKEPAQPHASRPDASFVLFHESIVVDHEEGKLYFQTIDRRNMQQVAEERLQSMAVKVLALCTLVEESNDVSAVTFSNIPWITKKSEFLERLRRTNFPCPDTCEYVYKSGTFTGTAYANYPKHKYADEGQLAPGISLEDLALTIHGQKVRASCPSMRLDLQNRFWNPPTRRPSLQSNIVSSPSNVEYEAKVRKCQEFISAGDSYELCLTDQSVVELRIMNPIKDQKCSPDPGSWLVYRKLRQQQPAPFASYLCIGSVTLVSASPERFLKWDIDGNCELRPMKGTVRKTPKTTLEEANALLSVPKEIAENLMIVDLVRHDLHGVCGSGNVTVPKLMVVEEYQSVYQMISIVQGKLPRNLIFKTDDPQYQEKRRANYKRVTGIDVLNASLPPGSMTGAPKKRSCEILQEVEQGKKRSIYSGVVGYMDFGGRADFSVTIRCMFKFADEDREEVNEWGKKTTIETWHVGAGGAVTTLSTPEGEREEMFTKVRGTMNAL